MFRKLNLIFTNLSCQGLDQVASILQEKSPFAASDKHDDNKWNQYQSRVTTLTWTPHAKSIINIEIQGKKYHYWRCWCLGSSHQRGIFGYDADYVNQTNGWKFKYFCVPQNKPGSTKWFLFWHRLMLFTSKLNIAARCSPFPSSMYLCQCGGGRFVPMNIVKWNDVVGLNNVDGLLFEPSVIDEAKVRAMQTMSDPRDHNS